MGHILNLVVQAFLFVNDEEEEEIGSYDEEDRSGEELDEKRQKERANQMRNRMGVMGKVHNIVVNIRASPNRTTEFKRLAGRSIPLNNRTRWNSWYIMLDVALQTEVLNAIRNYTEIHINRGTFDKKDELSFSNISFYRTIKSFLYIFYRATLFLEGQQATIERVLKTMNIIYEHLQRSLIRYIINYLTRFC